MTRLPGISSLILAAALAGPAAAGGLTRESPFPRSEPLTQPEIGPGRADRFSAPDRRRVTPPDVTESIREQEMRRREREGDAGFGDYLQERLRRDR